MSAAYMNANSDLDWVQAPPQAICYDRNSRRKNSNSYAKNSYSSKKYSNYSNDDFYKGRANKYNKSRRYKDKKNSHYKSGYNKKKGSYHEYLDSKNYKVCENQFDELSTDVSDGTSPDRLNSKSCLNMKVEVLGEVVVDRIHPKYKNTRRRNNKFAAACELKAPEPTEIAPPMFL